MSSKPDYKGFVERYDAMVKAGCPVDREELMRLAKKYHTPIPRKYR